MAAWLLGLFCVLLCHGDVISQANDNPQVSVVLKAHWNDTPLLLEASEFVSEIDEKLFWQFVWETRNVYDITSTDEECYHHVMSVVQSLLSPPDYHMITLALAVHAHSPKIQMFQQVSSEVVISHDIITTNPQCHYTFIHTPDDVIICSVTELHSLLGSIESYDPPLIESFDHCYPSDPSLFTLFLYGEVGTKGYSDFLEVLWPKMEDGSLRVCHRHWMGRGSRPPLILTGYGVQLAVKSTEYKAMDDTKIKEEAASDNPSPVDNTPMIIDGFNFTILKERFNDLNDNLEEYRKYLFDKRKELPELKPWEISDLGLQATKVIMESEYPLEMLQKLSQNLPLQAKSLSRTAVNKELNNEITYNQDILGQHGLSAGDSIMLVNGLIIREDDMDIFSLIDHLKEESRLLAGLQSLSIPATDYDKIWSVNVHPQYTSFAIDMRNESIIFINDIEKDRVYSRWPSSVTEFLRPAFPGSLRQIRKNAFTTIFVMDPLATSSIELMQYIMLFLEHTTPLRIGVLLVHSGCGNDNDNEDISLSEKFIAIINYLAVEKTPLTSIEWASSLMEDSHGNVSWDDITDSLSTSFKLNEAVISQVLSHDSAYMSNVKMSCEFYMSRGFDGLPQVLVNGIQLNDDEDLQNGIVTEVQQQTMEIQQQVFRRKITDSTDIYKYFMSKPNVLQRLSKHVSNMKNKKIDMSGRSVPPTNIKSLTNNQISALVRDHMSYLFNKDGEFTTKLITLWIVSDLTTPTGRRLALEGLKFALSRDTVRVGFMHNPAPNSTHSISHVIEAVLQSQGHQVSIEVITALFRMDGLHLNNMSIIMNEMKEIQKFKLAKFESKYDEMLSSNVWLYQVEFIRNVLSLSPGQHAILSNGRLVGPIGDKESFTVDDFNVLYTFEVNSYGESVGKVVDDLQFSFDDPDDDTATYRSDVVLKISSLLRSLSKSRRLMIQGFKHQHSVLSIPPAIEGPVIQCLAILDPLSSTAQRLTPLLSSLRDVLPINITIIFNPVKKLSALPLKDFYRSVIQTKLTFDADGRVTSSQGSMAVFDSLPLSPLFTLNMDVPHSWMVQSTSSIYDLDNIHLASVEREVYAEFELEYILVEGQCFDSQIDSPTPGLEYVMGTDREADLYDTIVMANLGYFQLKGRPGYWKLRLRQGKSSNIYQIDNYHQQDGVFTGDDNSGNNISHIPVAVTSFTGTVLVVHVRKRAGMEGVNLLDDNNGDNDDHDHHSDEVTGGFFDSISSLFKDDTPTNDGKDTQIHSSNETINIFSIASGHLYERFLRIMMLSVLKHTNNPVKFWFLKNYLSPQFKDFIPKMADRYGFEYELVQYKWPRWLHGQTEKQRLIWGYKILFLDVLFPLKLKKIIFVDADQVVRVDMNELLQVPLDGAPYGYTPFCDSRADMEGFRFWKRGYWKNHLGRRRYHISALYVIDLHRFRQLAAGDRLRGQYQMLSQDPNSLSNLDQDLPNNMIHNVPIKSLPQEWLWCATWCSEESKAQAKTIDLCNNPLTKEPKLVSALRIIPEWIDYDNEIKLLQQENIPSSSRPTPTPPDNDGHTSFHGEL
jgi:UDP-glucose:glycoprotein glucosyltransferase